MFSGRRFFNYKGTAFDAAGIRRLSMAVWGHHMFISEQEVNDYFSLTSMLLSIPAGMEYFGLLGTIIGGKLRYTTAMLFALAFIPQFLIGGLTGIMLATPSIDYAVNNSYFVVAHFHYTLFAGSVFGFFAGVYYWWPKAFGYKLNERLGKLHFILLVIGANATYLPMFGLGMQGMPLDRDLPRQLRLRDAQPDLQHRRRDHRHGDLRLHLQHLRLLAAAQASRA